MIKIKAIFQIGTIRNKNKCTVNPLYSDIRYNDKTRYNDNLKGTNPQPKIKRIIGEIKEYVI